MTYLWAGTMAVFSAVSISASWIHTFTHLGR
jgi:hypothetical protein